jgi:hypothetical protein
MRIKASVRVRVNVWDRVTVRVMFRVELWLG